MARVKLEVPQSVLVVVDVQPSLSKTIFEVDRVLSRMIFLAKVAKLLQIPILATEQNPSRMGVTVDELAVLLNTNNVYSKMAFSAASCPEFTGALSAAGRPKVVVLGWETHICVSQTVIDLTELGYEVVVCPDGVSARSQERHKLGMERIRDAGIVPAHTEAVAYEWLKTADHPQFRQALEIVKAHP